MQQQFAQLLTTALKQIKRNEGKKLSIIQDELGYQLGRESGGSIIEYWRKGNRPAQLDDLEKLTELIHERTQFKRDWFEEFLTVGGHSYPQAFCDRLFNDQSLLAEIKHTPRIRLPVRDFVGRSTCLDQIQAHLAQTQLVVLRGMGGIGKTECACAIAMRTVNLYPDGQIMVHVNGTTNPEVSDCDLARQILHVFQRESAIPHEPSAVFALYHSLLEQKTLLIVFDDVAHPEQVAQLITPTKSAFMITTRQRWNVPGARYIDFDTLDRPVAIKLAHSICTRLTTKQAETLVEVSGYLPLAIRVSASFLASDESYPIDEYLAQFAQLLDDEHEALAPVAASLKLSTQHLSPLGRQSLGMLSILHGSFSQTAALAIIAETDARMILSQLRRHHLIEYDSATKQYTIHALIGTLAQMYVGNARDAWLRIATYYIHQATLHEVMYSKGGDFIHQALTAFDTDRANLDRVWKWLITQEPDQTTDQLIVRFIQHTVHLRDLRYDVATHQIEQFEHGLAAAQRLGDYPTQRTCIINLGRAYMNVNRITESIQCYREGLKLIQLEQSLFDPLANPIHARDLARLEANALDNIGQLYIVSSDFTLAQVYLRDAVTISESIDDYFGQAASLNNLGVVAHRLGNLDAAHESLQQALDVLKSIGYQRGEAWTCSYLGLLLGDLHQSDQALAVLEHGLQIAQEIGDGMVQSQLTLFKGFILWSQGVLDVAHADWQQAGVLAQQYQYDDMYAWSLGRLALYAFAQSDFSQGYQLFQQRQSLGTATTDWEIAIDQRDIGRVLLPSYPQLALPFLQAWDTYQRIVHHADYDLDHQALLKLEAVNLSDT